MNTECFQGKTTNLGLLRIAHRLFDVIRASIERALRASLNAQGVTVPVPCIERPGCDFAIRPQFRLSPRRVFRSPCGQIKKLRRPPQCLVVALCLIPTIAAAEFKIDWASFGGPAGQSSGGGWRLSGAPGVGAGTASGGPFTLTSGYWSVVGTVPAPAAPRLTVERIGASVRVSWPRSAEAFALQETPTLNGAPGITWTPSAYARQTNTTQISVTVPLPVGSRYFRLHKP